MTTLDANPCHLTAWPPAAAMVEPTTPPISACDELEGIPKNHVSRFQAIPPARPAKTTVSVTSLVSTNPLAMVAATLKERKAPTRLRTPDIATATRGDRAPVAIDVAMALPVSWNPLVKSNANAVMTTSANTPSLCMVAFLSRMIEARKQANPYVHSMFSHTAPKFYRGGGSRYPLPPREDFGGHSAVA